MAGLPVHATHTSRARATIASLPSFVYDAHRGGALEVREDSLSGMERMLDSGAVQVLDLDTQELGDGTIVVMHDRTVDRTTSSTGPVSGYTRSTWRTVRLDTGSWLRPAPPPEPAPTLEAVLDRLGGRIVLTVEAKNPASVPAIARLLRDRHLTESVYVNTNSPEVARTVHAAGLFTHLWRSAAQMRTDVPARWASYVDLLDVDVQATDAQLRAAVRSGVPRVWAHTLTTRPQRDRIRRLGFGGIITDDPSYLLGRTSAYPAPPTVLAVHREPAAVQVSDIGRVEVTVGATSSTAIAGATVTARSSGVTGGAVSGAGALTVPLSTASAFPGRWPLRLTVESGHDREGRTWPGAATGTTLTLLPEDIALASRVTCGDRRGVSVRVDTRDSAASDYSGPRKETGDRRTVLGLFRATVQLTIRAGTRTSGPALLSRSRAAADTGVQGDGDGYLTFGWTAPRPGRYTAVVRQTGQSYAPAQVRTTFVVR